jgi:hypothetical protein
VPKKPDKPLLTLVDGTSSPVPPPRKLGKSGLSFWNQVQAEYAIDDVGGRELLLQCCQAKDRLERLAAQINADGEVIRTRTGGLKAHPALRDELATRGFICRTLGKLGISLEVIKPIGRAAGAYGWTSDADQ